MKKLLTLLLFILFLVNKNAIVLAAGDALNIWSKSLFPVLFPTLILSDILLTSGVIDKIPNFFYDVYSKIFKTSPYGLFVFIVSVFGATPTNAKILKDLYDSKLIDKNSLTKILRIVFIFFSIDLFKLKSKLYDVLSGDSLTKASLKMKLVKTLDTHIIIKTFRLLNVSINIGLKNIV